MQVAGETSLICLVIFYRNSYSTWYRFEATSSGSVIDVLKQLSMAFYVNCTYICFGTLSLVLQWRGKHGFKYLLKLLGRGSYGRVKHPSHFQNVNCVLFAGLFVDRRVIFEEKIEETSIQEGFGMKMKQK